jgi:hypothetical protein
VQCFVSEDSPDTLGYKVAPALGYKPAIANQENSMSTAPSHRNYGLYPFHQTCNDRELSCINIGCLFGMDPYTLEASVTDGAGLAVLEDA